MAMRGTTDMGTPNPFTAIIDGGLIFSLTIAIPKTQHKSDKPPVYVSLKYDEYKFNGVLSL